MMKTVISLVVICSLAGCGEKDQSLPATASKADTKAFQGVNTPYLQQGWKPGDRTSWENQMRARGQYQNEYVKIN